MKRVAVLGSTGSIGKNTLAIIRRFPRRFCVRSLAANGNIEELSRQVQEFSPAQVCIGDPEKAGEARKMLPHSVKVLAGNEGLAELSSETCVDLVMLGISGCAALGPLLSAVKAGKEIALANKEALVMAGSIVRRSARRSGSKLLPVDSEQSAIWQCMGAASALPRTIYLTASGGPFRNFSSARLRSISPKEALNHPRWKMGRKISVDSATLMNKGLELLEAMYLFDVAPGAIRVLVHPESVVHSMVEFADGAVIAQLGTPDMRLPIQYAMTYPERLESQVERIDFVKLKKLTFEAPDTKTFPCLSLAMRAAADEGTFPAVMNAADEQAVEGFLAKKIPFPAIAEVVERVMDEHTAVGEPDIRDVEEASRWAGARARELIENNALSRRVRCGGRCVS